MSHDARHERIDRQFDALAAVLGFTWAPCPASLEEGEDEGEGLDCKDRDCPECEGAGKVLRKKLMPNKVEVKPLAGNPLDLIQSMTPEARLELRKEWDALELSVQVCEWDECESSPALAPRVDATGQRFQFCAKHAAQFDQPGQMTMMPLTRVEETACGKLRVSRPDLGSVEVEVNPTSFEEWWDETGRYGPNYGRKEAMRLAWEAKKV